MNRFVKFGYVVVGLVALGVGISGTPHWQLWLLPAAVAFGWAQIDGL